MEFGERIKRTRQHQDLTQETVAKNLHVTRQTISSWERGKSYPDIDSLIRLSDYFQISLDTLLKNDTGLTDTLRKPVVLQSIKPVIKTLTIVDILFLIGLSFSHQTFISHDLFYLMGMVNVLALNQLTVFANSLDNVDPYVAWTKRRPWILLVTLGSAVAALILKFTGNVPLANDFTFLATITAIILVSAEFSFWHKRAGANQLDQLP